MNEHQPNRDMLSAYADGVLSPDAVRECSACAEALEDEKCFLAELDGLAHVAPPVDFTNAVMGRVAQHPVYQPGNAVPWRTAMRYGVAAALVLAVMLSGGVTWLLGSGTLQSAEPGAVVAVGISRTAQMAAGLLAATREIVSQGFVVLEAAAQLVWRITLLAAGSGWTVQLTLLLLTISMNYAFTRLVLNYQRRH